MSHREGPSGTLCVKCHGCVHEKHLEYWAMGETCFSRECEHPAAPAANTLYHDTPAWCPLREAAIAEAKAR